MVVYEPDTAAEAVILYDEGSTEIRYDVSEDQFKLLDFPRNQIIFCLYSLNLLESLIFKSERHIFFIKKSFPKNLRPKFFKLQ
jgi:hypothetical protein